MKYRDHRASRDFALWHLSHNEVSWCYLAEVALFSTTSLSQRCPLYPQERTYGWELGMSAKCQ